MGARIISAAVAAMGLLGIAQAERPTRSAVVAALSAADTVRGAASAQEMLSTSAFWLSKPWLDSACLIHSYHQVHLFIVVVVVVVVVVIFVFRLGKPLRSAYGVARPALSLPLGLPVRRSIHQRCLLVAAYLFRRVVVVVVVVVVKSYGGVPREWEGLWWL